MGGIVFVEFIRLSLFQRDQHDVFEHRQADGAPHTRESWLRLVFSKQINFRHRGDDFTYVPDATLTDDELILGRIGRERTVVDNAPPEEGFKERLHSEWQASVAIIDPSHHADGQKVAVQAREEEIGRPVAVFQSLVYSINHDSQAPYFIEAIGLVDPDSFWEFVKKNKGEIVSVTVEAIAPNMFGSRDDFDKELRELRDRERAQKIKVQLRNDSGLDPDTPRMHQVVDYTVEGGGAIKAKTRRGKGYNSRRKTRRVQVAEPPDPEKLGNYLADVLRQTIKTVLTE
jgi:hypothetical protein